MALAGCTPAEHFADATDPAAGPVSGTEDPRPMGADGLDEAEGTAEPHADEEPGAAREPGFTVAQDDLYGPGTWYRVPGGAVKENTVDGCEGLPTLAPASGSNGLGGYLYVALRDRGRMTFATGDVAVDDDGRPIAYRAAAGDTMHAVSQRFCIDYPGYLGLLNAVRRGDGDADLFRLQQEVWAGDIINLDVATVTTVGSQDGQVLSNAAPYSMPTQREAPALEFQPQAVQHDRQP
ncbi:hypothetical protein [Agrococcus terreus]|uniref:hypothetical protein n=1 Tax=Agrococcus terreus TaxID=574649 RepID=UPI00166CC4A9|nr:hypothetical protein [Agrococcus terreus]